MTKLYSKASCPGCTATLRAFKKLGVVFTEHRMDLDPEAQDYVMKTLGATQAPVVELADGTWWSGFNPDKIKGGIENGTIRTNI